MNDSLAQRLRAARRLVGESQAAFGQRIGVSQPTVGEWERGATPKVPLYLKLIAALDAIESETIAS